MTNADIIKGYEYEKGKYVVMTDEDLEKIKTKKDKTIHIIQFARMAEVNMIYYEKDYYAVPDTGAEKAYELLRQALLSQKKVAIAKTVMGTNEKLLVLYPTREGIIVKTLFYYDEIAAMPKTVPKMKLDENELNMAKMLIEDFKGVVPSDIDELQKLPGVGRKTANVIASVVYDKPAMAVDTHVFRVSNRIGLTNNSKTPLETEKELVKNIPEELIPIAHHWLILHGRYVCLARKPKCEECGLKPWCKYFLKQT